VKKWKLTKTSRTMSYSAKVRPQKHSWQEKFKEKIQSIPKEIWNPEKFEMKSRMTSCGRIAIVQFVRDQKK